MDNNKNIKCDKQRSVSNRNRFLIIIAIIFLTIAIILATSNALLANSSFSLSQILKKVNEEVQNFEVTKSLATIINPVKDEEEDKQELTFVANLNNDITNSTEEQTGNLEINVKNDKNEPVEGAYFDIYKKEDVQEIPNFELVAEGDYYFIEQDGKIVPNNLKETYSTAKSYIKIDLTNLEDMVIKINVAASLYDYSYGYAIISETKETPSYSNLEGRFMYLEDEITAKDYKAYLQGGKVYYLHLGYSNKYNQNNNFLINDISIVKGEKESLIDSVQTNGDYYFENKDGKLVSNNKHINNSNADSYIKVDLTNSSDSEIFMSTEISSQSYYDIGYVQITESEDIPQFSRSDVILCEYGNSIKNYISVHLEGGKIYYIHLRYHKDGSGYYGSDAFTINELYLIKTYSYTTETNSEGIANCTLPYGEYVIEQIESSSICNLDENPIADIKIEKEITNINFINERKNALIYIYYEVGEDFLDVSKSQYPPLKDGSFIDEEIIKVKYGDEYNVSPSNDVSENYKVISIRGETQGIVDQSEINIYYTYGLKPYNLCINKIDDDNNGIANTVFEISYQVILPMPELVLNSEISTYSNSTYKSTERYTTNEEGKINLQLYAGREYTLEEILPTNGYVKEDGATKFSINLENGQFTINTIEGDSSLFSIEDDVVKLTIPNKPSFKLIKQSETGVKLQGAKFTITTEDGQEVVDGIGEPVGEVENINGQDLRVVTTDENGEISEALPVGKYKITEVQAPNGYRLPEENEQIIEIEESQVQELYSVSEVEKKNLNLEYIYNGINDNSFEFIEQNYINPSKAKVQSTLSPDIEVSEILPSGEIFLTGVLIEDAIIPGECTVTGLDITLTKTSNNNDGVFIKTDENGKIEFVVQMYTNDIGESGIIKAVKVDDGYEIIGYFDGDITIPSTCTTYENEINLSAENGIFIAKVDNNGKFEWIKDYTPFFQISDDILLYATGIANYRDSMLQIQTTLEYDLMIPAEYTSTGEEVYLEGGNAYRIGINNEGKVASVKQNTDSFMAVFRTLQIITNEMQDNSLTPYYINISENDSLIITGYSENLYIPKEYMANAEEFNAYDEYVTLSINNQGKVEVAYTNYNYPIVQIKETNDGYVIVGIYEYGMSIPAEDTTNGEDIEFESDSEEEDMYIMKINRLGKVMWATDTDVMSLNIDIKVEDNKYYILDYDNFVIHEFDESKEVKNIVKEQNVITVVNETKEPNINIQKSYETENGLDYVVKNEKIKYTLTVTNTGDLAKEVVLKDYIPTGTTFVEGSIKINDNSQYINNEETIDLTTKTADDLANGITVKVNENQILTLCFEVQVHYMDINTTISNTAYVDDKASNRVDIPYINPEAKITCNITKDGTSTITSEDQIIDYEITYSANIKDYQGNAEIIIVDTLPYEIDESKSDIAGGTYDATNKTITWKENIEDINTIKNDEYNKEIKKNIKVVYKGINIKSSSMVNKVTGTINMQDTGNTNTVEAEFESKVSIYSRVIVRYVDEFGNEIGTMEIIEGPEGTTYITNFKNFDNYELVRVDGNTEGTFTNSSQEVTYVYKRIEGKVIVRYLEKDDTPDNDTDNVILAEEETITGYSGDEYETTRKEIDGYEAADPEPVNAKGTITKEDIYVTYYYNKKQSGKVVVTYIDEDSGEEIRYIDENGETKTYKEELQGTIGEKYTTEVKDIPYYKYQEEKAPENANGTYTSENIEVKYYYKKQTFNLGVEKKLSKLVLNGQEKDIKSNLMKIEIVADEIPITSLLVEYSITVTNNGEIEGTTDVIEKLPQYFTLTEGTSQEWQQQQDGTLKLSITLKPGETREFKVALLWNNGNNNLGVLSNLVQLSNVTNPANFEESSLTDNTSKVDLIVTVKTGGGNIVPLTITIFIALSMVVIGIIVIKKKVL